MPADYQILMQHCWATDAAARPGINRVLECLQYMIAQREQPHLAHADRPAGLWGATWSASAPLPILLASQPPRKQQWWQQPHLMQRASFVKLLGGDGSGSSKVAGASASVSYQLPCP